MPTQIIEARVMNLIATEAEWLIDDPVILKGEVAYVINGSVVNMKAGTEAGKKFSELPYNFDFGSGSASSGGPTPLGQVTRYRRFTDLAGTAAINGLFNKNNSLLGVYIFRKSGGDFELKIGTTDGGDEIGTCEINDDKVSFDLTELFSVNTNVYFSGFDSEHICDVIVIYNSFQVSESGDPDPDVIAHIRQEIASVAESLQSKIDDLASLIVQIPSGIVVQWDGGIQNIPAGWSIYNGNNNVFVIGAGDEYNEGSTGGEKMHKLTVAEMPSHSHGYTKYDEAPNSVGDNDNKQGYVAAQTSSTGGDQPHNNMPPYVARIFIIKD